MSKSLLKDTELLSEKMYEDEHCNFTSPIIKTVDDGCPWCNQEPTKKRKPQNIQIRDLYVKIVDRRPLEMKLEPKIELKPTIENKIKLEPKLTLEPKIEVSIPQQEIGHSAHLESISPAPTAAYVKLEPPSHKPAWFSKLQTQDLSDIAVRQTSHTSTEYGEIGRMIYELIYGSESC